MQAGQSGLSLLTILESTNSKSETVISSIIDSGIPRYLVAIPSLTIHRDVGSKLLAQMSEWTSPHIVFTTKTPFGFKTLRTS